MFTFYRKNKTYPAGRVGPFTESHEPRLASTLFVASAQSGYFACDNTGGITNCGMDHNDVYGCCGAAMVDHALVYQAKNTKLIGTLGKPKFNGLLATYFAYGRSVGEPGPRPDQGVNNSTWLAFLYKNGIIDGYAEIPLDQIDWYCREFLGVCTGQIINKQAIPDFNANPRIPWGSPGEVKAPNEGHDTLVVKTDGQGGGYMATWGGLIEFLLDYRGNITDAWVIFDKDDPRVDWTTLQAALDAIHGVVTPPPVAKKWRWL